jgi:hypothetical protein
MYIIPLGNHYMMYTINKWIWHCITLPIKRVNIMVYQNHMIENFYLMKKVDVHRDTPRSCGLMLILMSWMLVWKIWANDVCKRNSSTRGIAYCGRIGESQSYKGGHWTMTYNPTIKEGGKPIEFYSWGLSMVWCLARGISKDGWVA